MDSRRVSDLPRGPAQESGLKPGWAALKQLPVPTVTTCLGAAEPAATHGDLTLDPPCPGPVRGT